MKVEEIMTSDPECCTPGTSVRDVAVLMIECNCGEIPVCDEDNRPIGVVTDRDIVCRVVANAEDPTALTASDCMSRPVVTARPDMNLEECARLMEEHQIRRVPVVDASGACCGIVSQADIARKAPPATTAEVVERISEPNGSAAGAPMV